MQNTIQINLCGRIIKVLPVAWEFHLSYIGKLHLNFKTDPGRFEIINDIECRMAELMQGILKKGKEFIAVKDIECIKTKLGGF